MTKAYLAKLDTSIDPFDFLICRIASLQKDIKSTVTLSGNSRNLRDRAKLLSITFSLCVINDSQRN